MLTDPAGGAGSRASHRDGGDPRGPGTATPPASRSPRRASQEIDLGVIDLGVIDLGGDPGGDPRPPGPGASWSGRQPPEPGLGPVLERAPRRPRVPVRARDRLLRWWPLVGLTVVLVASTGAAAPVAHGLTLAYALPVAQRTSVALTDDNLYLATGTPASALVENPLWWLSAVRLADGTPRWRVLHGVAARPSSVEVRVADGVPLVTGWRTHTGQMSRPTINVDGKTTAYDPDTGAPLWTRPGFAATTRDGLVILELVRYTGNPPQTLDYEVSAVEIATGDVRWHHAIDLSTTTHAWDLAPDGRHLAALRHDGRLTVRDLDAGVDSVVELGQSWRDASVVIAGDLLRVSTLRDRRRTLAVYDRYPLRQRWALTDLPVTASLTPCGPVLCLLSGDELRALDPDTGERRWAPAETWLAPTVLPAPWPHGQLQLSRAPDTGQVGPDALVVDAATGQEGLRLGGWRAYEAGPLDHPYPLVDLREPGRYRPGHPHYDPGRLWLGRVHPGLTEVTVLGSLDGVRHCAVGQRHVACVTTGQRVEVWRIG